MTDRPILFSGPMVRALLDGRKTQTRRVLNWSVGDDLRAYVKRGRHSSEGGLLNVHEAAKNGAFRYSPGDQLWVRETWRPLVGYGAWDLRIRYRADESEAHLTSDIDVGDWRFPKAAATGNVSPLFMPRWASRLTLVVTDVRVQQLQDISAADSLAEGVECETCRAMNESACNGQGCFASVDAFHTLWDSLNAKRGCGWDANPWIVAITFAVHRRDLDQLETPND